jgi:hypothetical protein
LFLYIHKRLKLGTGPAIYILIFAGSLELFSRSQNFSTQTALGPMKRKRNRKKKQDAYGHSMVDTVALIERASSKKSICLLTLKVGANDRSAQQLQIGL